MDRFWLLYRTVVLDERAQAFVDDNTRPDTRFGEHWDGIVWLLSRKPSVGVPKSKAEPEKFILWISAGNDLAGTQEVWILYSFDEVEVTIHGVSFQQ